MINYKQFIPLKQGGISLLLFLFIFLGCVHSIHAQTSSSQKPLEIGDQVPPITLRNVINHSDSVIYPEEWKGKLVILSFWATWCSVCIQQMPKMAALQQEFGDKVLIINVTHEDSLIVGKILKTIPALKDIKLPYVTQTILDQYFPHRTVPHEVWIGGDGRVVAITGHNEINSDNIKKTLEKSDVNFSKKKDITDYDIRKPLISGGIGSYIIPSDDLKYSRMITSYIPGIMSFLSHVNKYNDMVTIKCSNTNVQNLFIHALATNPHAPWPENKDFYLRYGGRLIWEAVDSTFFFSLERMDDYNNTLNRDKLFNYEIVLPRKDSLAINRLMLEDLNYYFGKHYNLIASRESRMLECWALVCVDSSKIKSKGGKKQISISTHQNKINVRNATVDEFMFWWQGATVPIQYHKTPIINETDITYPIEFELEVDPSDFEAVKKAISAYGLEFRRVKRLLDVIVIKNKSF